MKPSRPAFAIVVVAALAAAAPALAGPYTDDLSKCLVESTTVDDRADLVKWMFAAASLHPAVRSFTSVSEEQLDAANKRMADLTTRLLTESCRDQTRKALRYEGPVTIQLSFQVLGQVAGQEMFSSPEVAQALSGLQKHFDPAKLQSLLDDDPAATPAP